MGEFGAQKVSDNNLTSLQVNWEALINHLPLGVAYFDTKFDLTFYNCQFLEILQCSEQEVSEIFKQLMEGDQIYSKARINIDLSSVNNNVGGFINSQREMEKGISMRSLVQQTGPTSGGNYLISQNNNNLSGQGNQQELHSSQNQNGLNKSYSLENHQNSDPKSMQFGNLQTRQRTVEGISSEQSQQGAAQFHMNRMNSVEKSKSIKVKDVITQTLIQNELSSGRPKQNSGSQIQQSQQQNGSNPVVSQLQVNQNVESQLNPVSNQHRDRDESVQENNINIFQSPFLRDEIKYRENCQGWTIIIVQHKNEKLMVKISDQGLQSTPRYSGTPSGMNPIEEESFNHGHRMIIIEKFCQSIVDDMIAYSNQFNMKLYFSFSHELRQPVKSTIQTMNDLKQELLKVAHYKSLQIINNYIDPILSFQTILNNLINDMLDLVQSKEKQIKFILMDFDIHELFRESLGMLSVQSLPKGVIPILDVSPRIKGLTKIRSDLNRVRQILINLLSNANKFTLKGFFCIIARQISPEVIQIGVLDSGIGISPENRQKIFQALNKIDQGDYGLLNNQGCGLGLLLSNTLVNWLQPDQPHYQKGIQVMSEEKVGSLFYFYLHDKQPSLKDSSNTNLSKSCIPLSMEELELNTCNDGYDEDLKNLSLTTQINTYMKFIQKQSDEEQIKNFLVFNEQMKDQRKKSYKFLNMEIEEDHLRDKKSIKYFKNINRQNENINHIITRDEAIFEESSRLTESSNRTTLNVENSTRNQAQLSSMNHINQSLAQKPSLNELHIKRALRIIIADDDYFAITSFKKVFQNLGPRFQVEIDVCNQGIEVIKLVEQQNTKNFDAIFLDLEMPPGINGFQTLQKIKQLKLKTKIIACTAHESKNYEQDCLKLGFNYFLTKPPKPLQVMDILDQI